MTRKKQTLGKCIFCGREMTGGGLSRHLSGCTERRKAIEKANQKSGASEDLYHLHLKNAWSGEFWLHLEMRGSAKLENLDHYLRKIWLECCGHLSQFSVGGWNGEEISMSKQVKRVFHTDLELTHIYDFGTSSETLIKMVGLRHGKPLTTRPIFLMARNEPPETHCMECGKSASWLCLECLYDFDESGEFCDEHIKEHLHEDYGEPVPLVNSPRVGMCGYYGPANPPY